MGKNPTSGFFVNAFDAAKSLLEKEETMKLFNTLRKRQGQKRRTDRGKVSRVRLALEALEGRLAPSANSLVLFYNSLTGVAETGRVTDGAFTDLQVYGGFAPWTHVAGVGGSEVLFFDANSGTAETGRVAADGTFTDRQVYAGFASWTHVTGVGDGLALFYNATTGTAETGRVDADGSFTDLQVYTGFASWTHVAGVGG